MGFETMPLVSFPATGRSGADFPAEGEAAERTISMATVLDGTSLLLALTEFSMTAALCDVCKRRPGADVFRAASMPGVQKWMEETSLAADYTRDGATLPSPEGSLSRTRTGRRWCSRPATAASSIFATAFARATTAICIATRTTTFR